MKTLKVELPSGLTVVLRCRMLEDDSVIFNEKFSNQTFLSLYKALIENATIEVVDPGPKPDVIKGDGSLIWDNVLWGDFLYALKKFREISFENGHLFKMNARCPECGNAISYEVDLRDIEDGGEMITYRATEEQKNAISSGEWFHVMVDGNDVQFRLDTVADQLDNAKMFLAGREDTSFAMLKKKIVGITGPAISNPNDKAIWLKGLTSDQADSIHFAIDDNEIGIDTAVECQCSRKICGGEFEIEVPFDSTFLKSPRNRRQERRRKKRKELRSRRSRG